MTKTFDRIFTGLLMLTYLSLAAVSCKFDDGALWEAVNDLDERVQTLEKATTGLQVQISGLNEIVEEIQANNLVESVVQQEDGDFTITFSNGKVVEVIYEKVEEITIPTLTVKKEGDIYYWAYMKGDELTLLLDGAKPVPVTDNEPEVRVNEETYVWEISADGGKTWISTDVIATGEGTDTLFAGISEDEENWFITLADGTVLPLPKAEGLSFRFDTEEEVHYVKYGGMIAVPFTSTGVSDMTVIKPTGWKATFAGNTLLVTAPVKEHVYAEKSGAVEVVAVSLKGKSVTATLNVFAGDKPVTVSLRKQWATSADFFTTLELGSADSHPEAQELAPANTFLVRPGQLYRIKADVRGCGRAGVEALGIMEDSELGGLEIRADGSINTNLTGENEYIYFKATETTWTDPKGNSIAGGNGVFSLVLGEEVVWTWMIWSRPDDPADEMVGDFTQMGANLGAWGPATIQKKVVMRDNTYSFNPYSGVFYSWGGINAQPGMAEKDRALGSSTMTKYGANMDHIWYFDESGVAIERKLRQGQPVPGLGESIKNPAVLNDFSIASGDDIYAGLWGGDEDVKTIFDPCPYGYKVPSSELFTSYSITGEALYLAFYNQLTSAKITIIPGGMIGMEYTDPKTGLLKAESAGGVLAPAIIGMNNTGNREANGYYWSSSLASASVSYPGSTASNDASHATAYRMYNNFGSAKSGTETVARMNAAPIRCVRFDGEK